ncbi:DeoR/GlpR family DNA-binding transcription regulator [Amorphoplanes nipponensis]|uniref:DeoR family transcriptional regulator n=1 Tax=Actinoplanes nipponensis TaxID=135950 RepID=A0A919JGL7_9ACTN|nr:DeoR/GlpR family DNA-binding transcription regulator [Actinoplanes nipponensis]GIE49030.1 DeoR family transcriptional regulator [Actinoplanes nipponensis]
MNAAVLRQATILDVINRDGGARTTDLGHRLGVSRVTARRDIEALAGRGLVSRVRGGAIALTRGPGPAGRRDGGRRREKLAIARVAAGLARAGQAVGVLAGTTTALLAAALREVPGLTVVTNSIRVADVFHDDARPDRTVVLIGGTRTASGALVGPVAQHTAAGINLDLLFLGAHGMTARAGFTTPDPAEARTHGLLLRAARRVVVLADHTKWGVTGVATIAPLAAADVLVSDEGLGRTARAALRGHVGELRLAAPG